MAQKIRTNGSVVQIMVSVDRRDGLFLFEGNGKTQPLHWGWRRMRVAAVARAESLMGAGMFVSCSEGQRISTEGLEVG